MSDPPADLVILGRVATLAGERGFGWREALAVRGDRVLAAGARADVAALGGPRTTTWRLPDDLMVVPGVVDTHLHLLDAAMSQQQLDLAGLDAAGFCLAVADAHERLAARERGAAAGAPGAWLIGRGWSVADLGTWPDASWLRVAAPGRPVALWSHDHHTRLVSDEALAAAGLVGVADPSGGRIGRRADGTPDGLLYEGAASLVDKAIPAADAASQEEALLAYAADLARLGVVAVHDPGQMAPRAILDGPDLYRTLAGRGGLPLRVVASVRENQLEAAIAAGFRTGTGVGRYRDGWLKLFADGALGSRTAWLLEPYEAKDPAGPPPAGPRGAIVRDRAALLEAGSRAVAAGIGVQIHAIGDAAVRAALDVLAALPRVGRPLHRVEHAQLVHPSDRARFGRLRIAASVQACHLLNDAPAARAAWGGRTSGAFPLRDLTARGALMPLGTDAPVEPPDPWPGVAAAVTRRGATWGRTGAFHPEQAVDLARALRAACLDGPGSLGVTDEGHLGPGARADLLVVPRDALLGARDPDATDEAVAALATLRPQATLIDGAVAWRDDAFDP